MTPKQINDKCKYAWLIAFIAAIVLINGFIAYKRMTRGDYVPLNPYIVGGGIK